MFAGYSPTRLSPTLATHYLDLSRADVTDFPRRCSTPPFTHSPSSAHLGSSRWFDAKPAATISLIFPHSRRVRLCSLGAWRSSCCPWLACRRSREFSESYTCLALRCARVPITARSEERRVGKECRSGERPGR